MPFDNKIYFSTNIEKPNASYLLGNKLTELLIKHNAEYKSIVIFCIGTDRCTGDSLGPLTGHQLSKLRMFKKVSIYGTLENPIHAKNLEEYYELVNSTFISPFIIAVDASLGKAENIGNINIIDGPVYPGAGVNKKLQPVGDISLTGIVNTSGFMEFMVLQNTRLSVVMKMAEVISSSLYISLKRLYTQDIAYF